MGMAAICTVKPGETVKQLVALVLSIGVFLTVAWSMRDLERAKKMRHLAAVAGVALLIMTLLFGKEYYGAKNWLVIGPLSIQPSELAKVCFVYVGASAMDRLMNKRNLIFFIAYTLIICGCLALMNDFGTALIFFFAFLMIAYLRSGSVGTIALAVTALGFAGVIALKLAPHALRRFSVWRHIWEDPLGAGYQQTRALMCLSSGGLFGLGIGKGWMKNVFAADSDVVFATLAEEWGLIMPVLLVLAIVALALFAVRCAVISRSSFYTIGACTAGAILIVQTIFNVLGTVDVLPLTGVTFPFVSNGGSSMICAWGLLAFIKAADTRKSASFAVRSGKVRRDELE
jgi:cell division protein FtsW (lipid II flippase)